MTSTPLRTQYIFDLSGVKGRSRTELLNLQRQWDTFERVENYNDIVYQKLATGDRGTLYYQFASRQESLDYRNGQELHVLRYPSLAATGAFNSISERPMPDVPVTTRAPTYSMTSLQDRGLFFSTSTTESERLTQESDLTIYTHVSTFNGTHYFKYNFVSNDEKIAYHRAERLLRMGSTAAT
jgi:hypothetical protein